MTEVYKIHLKGKHLPSRKNYLFFGKIFIILEISKLADQNKNTVRYGLQTICYRTPYLRASLPKEH